MVGDDSIKCTSTDIHWGILGTVEFSPHCFNHRNWYALSVTVCVWSFYTNKLLNWGHCLKKINRKYHAKKDNNNVLHYIYYIAKACPAVFSFKDIAGAEAG